MTQHRKRMVVTAVAVIALTAGLTLPAAQAQPSTAPIAIGGMDMKAMMKENNDQMASMSMTGKVDVDFAMMMRMHHQGAVQMSEAQLRDGKDPEMMKMARKIISDQKKGNCAARQVPCEAGKFDGQDEEVATPCRQAQAPRPTSWNNRYRKSKSIVVNSIQIDQTLFDAAIIDLDGTMVDTLGDFSEALNRMLADLGLAPIAGSAIEMMVGKGSEHLIRSVLAHVGADAGHYEAAWASYQRHYEVVNGHHSEVFPGVLQGLQALQTRGLRLACLTNKPTAFARALLKAKALDGYFSEVFGGDAFERKKPDPLPLIRTCAALGSVPGRTLMVGDSSNDAQAARAAGCPVVLVTYGYNHGEPVRGVDADGFVDSLAELA